MKFIQLLAFLLFAIASCDLGFQNEQELRHECDSNTFIVVDTMPVLIGGISTLREQIVYPKEALELDVEGRVIVQFVVNKKGETTQLEVIRGIGYGADEEAVRVVRNALFSPGVQRGEPVCVQYSLPIVFRLPN